MTTFTVGQGQQFTTLNAAVAAAQPGDTIDVQAGTYINDFPSVINGLTIQGVGGIAIFTAANGAQPSNGKGYLDVEGKTTLSNLDISGVTVPDANGAAIRYESGSLLIENSSLHGNQDGLLSASDPNGSITIDHSEIYNNGLGGDGHTHNLYISYIGQFTLTNSYIHDANIGHEIKSRAANNTITNDRIFDNSSTASYSIDLPSGGNATISGNVIEQGPNSNNPIIVSYGEEGSSNPGNQVSFTNNTVRNDDASRTPYLFNNTSGASIIGSGNTVYGLTPAGLDVAGTVSRTGFTFTTTSPTLDLSSGRSAGAGSSGVVPQAPVITSAGVTTNQASEVVAGNTAANSTVTLYDNGASLGTVLANGSGSWSKSVILRQGANALTATDTVASQVSAASTPVTFTLDTTPPAAPVINSAGGSTSQAAQQIAGTAEAESTVTLYDNNVAIGSVAADAGGNWTISATLGQRSNALTATAADVAGNVSLASKAVSYSLVIAAPAPPVITSAGGMTNQASQMVAGTAVANSTVTLYDNGASLGAVLANGSGKWSKGVTLGQGANALAATDTVAKQLSPRSSAVTYTLDTTAPRPAIRTITQNANGTVTLSGVSEGKSTVTVSDSVLPWSAPASTTSGTAAGSSNAPWSVTSTTKINLAKINSFGVSATDAAGNTGTAVGGFFLSSTASETLAGTPGVSDVFAFLPGSGTDLIKGFEPAATSGGAHDCIDISGFGYTSFSQLHIANGPTGAQIQLPRWSFITVAGVNASQLSARDFLFS